MGGITEEPPTDGEEYSSEHEISENSEGTSERLFILSNRAFLTPAQYMKCLEKVEEIKFKPPFYVSIMSKTTVWQHNSECSPILINSNKSPKYLYAYLILTFALCYVYKQHFGSNNARGII
ncbi:B3 domain-containing protein [Hordeum vulgare]|nr:B3 domain-containing protein [Hordeum vulgare]